MFLVTVSSSAALAAQIQQPKGLVSFDLRDKYLIVVEATVNGMGPFSFLLDTGSTPVSYTHLLSSSRIIALSMK